MGRRSVQMRGVSATEFYVFLRLSFFLDLKPRDILRGIQVENKKFIQSESIAEEPAAELLVRMPDRRDDRDRWEVGDRRSVICVQF